MESEFLHIGKLVEKAFNQSGKTKTEFAYAIGVANQNLNREFTKEDWGVIRLIKAGRFLGCDFLTLLAGSKPTEKVEKPTVEKMRVLLQIEIEDDKVEDVLKVINNNSLYDVIRTKS